ncbi:MAG: acyl dehydratase [Planctomycetota bacterium]|jgi:acyl dehydratase
MSTAPQTSQRRGLWFDEFTPGQTFASAGRTITETDVVNFACLSGDFTRLHTDATAARRMPFRQRIAHGMLIQSIATGLGTRIGIFEGSIAAFAGQSSQWLHPVFFGDTIRVEFLVDKVDQEPSRRSGHVFFSLRILNQDDELVATGTWDTLMLRDKKRPIAAGANQ